jgi:hypothetical protein
MRLFDLFLDTVADTTLFEMAFKRKKAKDSVASVSYQLALHILKIIVFEASEERSHWIKEADVWLRQVQNTKLKNTKAPLPYLDLMEILHEGYLETVLEVQDLMNYLHQEYPTHQIIEPDAKVVHKQLLDLYSHLCFDLANKRFTKIEDYLTVNK